MTYRKPTLIQQFGSVSGTGNITLGNATSGSFRRLQDLGLSDGDTLDVTIRHISIDAEIENVLGSYAFPGILTPSFVASRSASPTGALISFTAGSNNVVISATLPGGAMVAADGSNQTTLPGALTIATGDLALNNGSITAAKHQAASGSNFIRVTMGSDASYAPAMMSAWRQGYTAPYGAPAGSIIGQTRYEGLGSDGGYAYWGGWDMAMDGANAVGGGASYLAAYINTGGTTAVAFRIDGPTQKNYSYFPLIPSTDNTLALGGASNRWSVVYAGTGAINTSGADEKLDIVPPSDAERKAAARIRAIGPKRYKLKDAVAAKGDGARYHFGFVAEDVRDALAAEGLDPWAYGMLCADPVSREETYEVEGISGLQYRQVPLLDADGKPVMRLGLRYDELQCFLMSAAA